MIDKQTKYGEENHERGWYFHHSSAPYMCQSKKANIFTANPNSASKKK